MHQCKNYIKKILISVFSVKRRKEPIVPNKQLQFSRWTKSLHATGITTLLPCPNPNPGKLTYSWMLFFIALLSHRITPPPHPPAHAHTPTHTQRCFWYVFFLISFNFLLFFLTSLLSPSCSTSSALSIWFSASCADQFLSPPEGGKLIPLLWMVEQQAEAIRLLWLSSVSCPPSSIACPRVWSGGI